MNNWKQFTFENAPLEIIDGDRGVNYPKQADFMPFGYCLFLNAGNVTENGFDFADCSFISKEKDNKLRKGKLSRLDIVLTTRGTVGNLVFYNEKVPYEHVRINSGMVIFRVNQDEILPRYFYFLLKSNIFVDQVKAYATGSAQPQLPIRDIKRFEFLLPPLPEQHAIAGILGALDDKIELNRRMNRTLESMAQAVFRHWFVENEHVGNWEIKSIGEITDRVGMGPFGSSIKVDTFVEEGIPVINGQQLREFMLEDSGFNFISLEHAEKLKNANVYPGDIVLTHRGTLGQVSLIPDDAKYKRYIVSQSQFFVRCNLEKITPNFLIHYLQSPEGQHKLLANRSAVGVPAIAQPVTYLRTIEIPVPPKEILNAFENIIAPLHSKYSANRKESRTLASLRDSLLPKLMRGEVRVSEVKA